MRSDAAAGKLTVVLPPLAAATWRQMRAGDKVIGEVLAALGDGRYRVKIAGRDTLCESPLALQPGERLKLVVGKAGGQVVLKVMIEPPAEQAAGVELAKLKLPTDRVHKQVAAALTAAGTPVSPEPVALLARQARAWGLTRPAEYRTLVAQWRQGYPLSREIFDRLRAAERPWPPAARHLPTPPDGPGLTPERFDPAYWDRLGATLERRLAGRETVPRDTLREQLRQGATTEPKLREILFKLEGKFLAAGAPKREAGAAITIPLLFTGSPKAVAAAPAPATRPAAAPTPQAFGAAKPAEGAAGQPQQAVAVAKATAGNGGTQPSRSLPVELPDGLTGKGEGDPAPTAEAVEREPGDSGLEPRFVAAPPDGMAGELRIEPEAGGAPGGKPRRPRMTLALALSRLGELTVDFVPQGDAGYAIGFAGADPRALAWLERHADELRRALAPLLPATVSFAAAPPAPTEPAAAGGVDFQA